EFPPAYFGVLNSGGVAVPLNLRMDPETLGYVVQNAEIDHIVASQNLPDQAKNLAEAGDVGDLLIPNLDDEGVTDLEAEIENASAELDRPYREYDDVAIQPYTSGTTGKPKGVLLTHENLLTTVESYDNGGLPIDPDDSALLILPLFHIYGLNALMSAFLYTGGKMVLQAIPNPSNMLGAIDDHELTTFAGVPAMYNMMFREYQKKPGEYDVSSLENVVCAAAPLADDTRKKIESEWDVSMVEGWGMTETAPAGTTEPSRGVRKEAGCIGPPVPNIELKLVDPETRETKVDPDDLGPRGLNESKMDFDDEEEVTGEIAIRGSQVFEGYFKLPEKTEEVFDDEGWFYTDDIARVDSDGYFWMVDRADDMIIAGGENIYPAEVENALYEHPDVAEAAVVGAPHEIKGEAPVAFVVLEDDADVTEDELRKFTLNHVATYAHPRRIFFVDELPRSATQKVQRYKLEEEAEERIDGELESSDETL
ncbi:MAG: class I adenylate-forming enzyme family protein, partial [Halobacteria archaeon]|nr:class I adenylate-forming enzyme family protein [Halobacteria archaeon]